MSASTTPSIVALAVKVEFLIVMCSTCPEKCAPAIVSPSKMRWLAALSSGRRTACAPGSAVMVTGSVRTVPSNTP
jgi:hypothetical protein